LAISLWPERRTETKLDASEVEQLRPQVAGEDRIPITDNGARKTVKAHNVVKECLCHSESGIWVTQWYEMSHLRETIHHSEDDTLPAHPGKSFDKIHGYVAPYA
jgi:hypothetical protein